MRNNGVSGLASPATISKVPHIRDITDHSSVVLSCDRRLKDQVNSRWGRRISGSLNGWLDGHSCHDVCAG